MQIYIAKYLKKSDEVRRCKRKKRKSNENFNINATRDLSSGDFSSDTTGGRLKVKNVNDKWVKRGWYEKCWLDKGGGKKQIKPPWVTPVTSPKRCNECLSFRLHRDGRLNKI